MISFIIYNKIVKSLPIIEKKIEKKTYTRWLPNGRNEI
jgi:hypothetical protein